MPVMTLEEADGYQQAKWNMAHMVAQAKTLVLHEFGEAPEKVFGLHQSNSGNPSENSEMESGALLAWCIVREGRC